MSGSLTDLEQLTLDLLRIPSVIGSETAIADHVEGWLRARTPASLVRIRDNLFARARADREGRPKILLLGHLDTVPASAPNPPRIEGERIHGLGASDMKGGDALILDTLAWAAQGHSPCDVAIGLYAAEEGPFEKSGLPELKVAAGTWMDDVALAVCFEPTDNAIELGCLGTLHAWVRFHGARAHSARPWQGRNAIHMAAPFLAHLAQLAPREVVQEGLSFVEVASATMVRYDGARNVVPGGFDLNVNLRFAPDRDSVGAQQHLEALVDEALGAEARASGQVTLEITDLAPAGRVCRDNPHVQRLEQALGADGVVRSKQAWTDVGRLASWGVDAINFGPGSGAQAHQVGEHASRARLAEAQAIVRRWLG
ncbi:MAG: succinyl-diaminopimelate desuccinylase [Planctomycetota bacterium]